MTKRIETASAAEMTDEQEQRERAAINRDLDDIERRLKAGHDVDEIAAAVGRARLRVIAFARRMGGAAFARMMRPHDEPVVGDNVVRLRRRRWV